MPPCATPSARPSGRLRVLVRLPVRVFCPAGHWPASAGGGVLTRRFLRLITLREYIVLIGLDFETANFNSGSICSVGIACLNADGTLAAGMNCLVRPHRSMDWVSWRFFQIHGIGDADLRDAPEFPDIWDEFCALVGCGGCVVIHNAPFDLGQLRSVMKLYGLSSLEFEYVCSLSVSRKCFPELTSHSLSNMADYFGIRFNHHEAFDDARTCAEIVRRTGIPPGALRRFAFDAADTCLI